MAVEDTPPSSPTDKIITFSISNKVPIKLDLGKHNYNSWSSFSLIRLGSLELMLKPTPLLLILNGSMGSSQGSFYDNKDARAINLDNELRSVKIGKMSVNEYCTKIKSMNNRLKNLDCDVSEKNVVIYAVNGLDSCFATLVEIIRHREPLPTFETIRNMLLLKESSFTDSTDASTMLESSSSSPTILLASSSSDAKGNASSKPLNNLQLCNHFSRGTCKFGDRCKFVNDHRNRAVTKPSTLLVAFMSTSSTTWHQRLGHLGDEVLRSLSYRKFISCNKAKSTHVCHACQLDPNWCNDMYDEYDALVKNGTWILVPRPTDANLVRSMWLFKHKIHVDGTLCHYKARLVSNGSSHQLDVDLDETFSPVVKPVTIRKVLSLVVSRQWPIHQLDVNNAFLNGDLFETVICINPLVLLTLVILIMYIFCKGLCMV
nr:hybrid signal transduction histidine kinase M [Tanacetum cinerariifolium]